MKRYLLCSMALVGLLSASASALVATDVEQDQVRRDNPGFHPSARTNSCETAVDLFAAMPHDVFYPGVGPDGLWFYLAPQAADYTLCMSSCYEDSYMTGDSNIAIATGTDCSDAAFFFDQDSPHYPCSGHPDSGYPDWFASIDYTDLVFAAGTPYWVVFYDYDGVGGDLHITAEFCEAPVFSCPAGSFEYDELNEFGCGDYSHDLDCGETWCGEIDAVDTDSDWYWIYVSDLGGTPAGSFVTFNVYGDDTPGQNAFGYGLDPYIRLWDDLCSTVVAEDDDGGTGFDARLTIECLPEGIYMVEVFSPYSVGPYLLTASCAPCCPEDNTGFNPDVLTTVLDYEMYLEYENALAVPVSLCDYCNLSMYTAGGDWCFSNGLCFLPQDAGEWFFNVYQPAIPVSGECGYVLQMATDPGFTDTCTPLFGVAQSGSILGWFGVDPGLGLFPSVYNDPLTPGNTTFLLDGSAACCDGLTLYVWYAWLDNGCDPVSADEQPATFALGQNYPNPFNPTTTIDYSVSETSNVTLTVSNIAGQTVATLVDGMVERGEHSVSFDASAMTTGVYFYTLDVAGQSVTKKMVLVK